jgi:hypothetical protein
VALPGFEFSTGLLDVLGEKKSSAFSDPMAKHSDQLRLFIQRQLVGGFQDLSKVRGCLHAASCPVPSLRGALGPRSGQQVRNSDHCLRPAERRDAVAGPEKDPGLVGPVSGISVNFEHPSHKVEKPGFWNPGAGVERDLPLAVMKQRAVGNLDDQQSGRGMALQEVIDAAEDDGDVGFRLGVFTQGKGELATNLET